MSRTTRTALIIVLLLHGLAEVGYGGFVLSCGTIAETMLDKPEQESAEHDTAEPSEAEKAARKALESLADFVWLGRIMIGLGLLHLFAIWTVARKLWKANGAIGVLSVVLSIVAIAIGDLQFGKTVPIALVIFGCAWTDRQEAAARETLLEDLAGGDV